MATITVIKMRLAQIRQELAVFPVALFGRSNNDAEVERQAARLDQLSGDIRGIIRDLKTRANLVGMQQQGLWSIPNREKRWQAASGLKQQGEDIGAAQKEAADLLDVVLNLLKKNGMENPMQAAKDLGDLLENFEKAFGHEAGVTIAEIQHLTGPAYVQGPAAEHLALEPHQFVPMLALIYLGLKWLVKKRRGK